MKSNATCGLGIPYTFSEEEDNVSLDWEQAQGETTSISEYERGLRQKSKEEHPDVQTIDVEHPSQFFGMVLPP